jgi:hypothetical protein
MQFASCVYVMEWRVHRMGCCVYRILCYVTYFIGKRCTCITNVSILCINYLTMSPTRRHPREFSIHHVSIKQTMHYATKDRSVVKAETVVPSHHVPTTSLASNCAGAVVGTLEAKTYEDLLQGESFLEAELGGLDQVL